MNQPKTQTISRRSHSGRSPILRRGLAALAISGVLLSPVLTVAPAQAAKAKKGTGIEPWQGRRVLLLLPLQLGEGFNADRNFGQAILSRAESLLQQQLQATGKFSVIQAHRFSPLIQRGLQEKRLTQAQVDDYLKAQTLENANTFLGQFVFERPAMIADFRLEEVRSISDPKRPSVQVQVSGRLYEAGNPIAVKSPVFTSEPARTGQNNIERFLGAADNAFMQAAMEMVAPLEDIQLPAAEPTPVAADAPAATPGTATPAPAAPNAVAPSAAGSAPSGVTLPGDRPITGASGSGTGAVPQLPPAQPPLGLTVPNAPATR
ncbi:MAG: hypothetical protein JWN98_346 [Abditibacteriota bacterium]|nr:hypothetical protein [Abditibacteriota bacterium]